MTGTKYQRSHHFVQRAFQGRFIAWMVGLILFSGVCSGLLLYFLLGSDLLSDTQSLHVRMEQVRQGLAGTILIGNLFTVLVIGLAAGFMVLHISHRIAGPLYRLQGLFSRVAAGHYDIDASLRDDDQLQELADSFTHMARELASGGRQRQTRLEECQRLNGRLRQETGLGTTTETIDRIERLLTELRQPVAPH